MHLEKKINLISFSLEIMYSEIRNSWIISKFNYIKVQRSFEGFPRIKVVVHINWSFPVLEATCLGKYFLPNKNAPVKKVFTKVILIH